MTYNYQYGSNCPNVHWEGGGGGSWSNNGGSCIQTGYNANQRGGKALNGTAEGGREGNYGQSNNSCAGGGDGGFGGGAGSGDCSGASGGGGGYTGGHAAYSTSGNYIVSYMGGGSFNSGTTQSNSVGNTGHGYVTITKQ